MIKYALPDGRASDTDRSQSNHSVAETQNGLTEGDRVAYIGLRAGARLQMIDQSNSYRYYYYYGPLSAWRDGRAMSCRETIR